MGPSRTPSFISHCADRHAAQPKPRVRDMNPTNEGEEPGAVDRTLKPGEQRILSMRPHGQTGSSIELILRKRIAEFVQAIRDKDPSVSWPSTPPTSRSST